MTPLDEDVKVNTSEENIKVYNYSNPTMIVFSNNIIRFYLFELGLNFELLDDLPPTIDDIFIVKTLRTKHNLRHLLRYLTY